MLGGVLIAEDKLGGGQRYFRRVDQRHAVFSSQLRCRRRGQSRRCFTKHLPLQASLYICRKFAAAEGNAMATVERAAARELMTQVM